MVLLLESKGSPRTAADVLAMLSISIRSPSHGRIDHASICWFATQCLREDVWLVWISVSEP